MKGYNSDMILSLLLMPIFTLAHIVQDDVSVVERKRYTLKEACSKAGLKDSALIEVISGTVFDCMGRKVEAAAFCDKELLHDPYYLRGYVDEEKREVVCVTGKKVLFKYQCVKLSDRALCSAKPEASCIYIQKKLARRLDLVHFSFVKTDKGIKQLNCFFESLPLSEKKRGL
jgi:hypothetical protein